MSAYEVMPEPFALTDGDKLGGTWLRLVEHLKEELRVARSKNDDDKQQLTDLETANLRGQIRTLKRMIALGDTLPVITDS